MLPILGAAAVFVEQGEGGAGEWDFAAPAAPEGGREKRLAGAERATEGDQGAS